MKRQSRTNGNLAVTGLGLLLTTIGGVGATVVPPIFGPMLIVGLGLAAWGIVRSDSDARAADAKESRRREREFRLVNSAGDEFWAECLRRYGDWVINGAQDDDGGLGFKINVRHDDDRAAAWVKHAGYKRGFDVVVIVQPPESPIAAEGS